MEARPNENAEYVLDKPLGKELAIVRRVADGEIFLCHEFDIERRPEMATLRALYHRGAYASAAEVLNHENLISLTGPIRNVPFRGRGGRDDAQQYILWDWCDAGTLDTILREPPMSPSTDGFLPESLVWHVAMSMLKALMWLHEGWRERYNASESRKRSWYRADEDWMPIFHREIEPRNIYFQSPRGTETYGLCKLGNFGNCYVSGSMSSAAFIDAPRLNGDVETDRMEPAVTTKEGDPPLRDVKDWWQEGMTKGDGFMGLEISQRPYTSGSELFALGAILYRMMVGWRFPNPDGCDLCGCIHINPTKGCRHVCTPDVHVDEVMASLTKYSDGLREVVADLLGANRDFSERAVLHYQFALDKYLSWKENSPDGKLYRDDLDDRLFRVACDEKRKEIEEKTVQVAAGVS